MENLDPASLTKKERKKFYEELKKKEASKKRTSKKFFVAFIILIMVAGISVLGFFAFKASSKPLLGEVISGLGRDHIATDSKKPEYNSNPPTSGPHFATPASWGVYDKELPDQQIIHNLEHGGVWITFNSDLEKEVIEKLKEIASSYKSKVIMTPRAANDSKIALASWERLLKLDSYNEEEIKDFVARMRNKGPESVPD